MLEGKIGEVPFFKVLLMQIENTEEHFNISSYALYLTIKNLSEICMWGKIMVLYYIHEKDWVSLTSE